MAAVLDALIQMKAAVPADTLRNLASDFPNYVAILLSRLALGESQSLSFDLIALHPRTDRDSNSWEPLCLPKLPRQASLPICSPASMSPLGSSPLSKLLTAYPEEEAAAIALVPTRRNLAKNGPLLACMLFQSRSKPGHFLCSRV